jgi:hypothetical protein
MHLPLLCPAPDLAAVSQKDVSNDQFTAPVFSWLALEMVAKAFGSQPKREKISAETLRKFNLIVRFVCYDHDGNVKIA